MNWHTPIYNISMIGPVYEKRLAQLEIETVGQLLLHLPNRYEDWSQIRPINQLAENQPTTVIGKVLQIKNVFTRNRKQMQKLTLGDKTGLLSVIWFNQPYIIQSLKVNDQLAVAGIPKWELSQITMVSPEFEMVRNNKELLHCGRFVPIYPQTQGVSSKWLRSRIALLLQNEKLMTEYLPETIQQKNNFLKLAEALNKIHFPKQLDAITEARRRLAFDELFALQMQGKLYRKAWKTKIVRKKMVIDQQKINAFLQMLPFTLTKSQEKVLNEILVDLSKNTPMNRLLQGDVGSGKTVIAAIASYVVHLNGYQTMIMAPTEILAEQHYQTLTKFLTPLGLTVELRTSSHKKELSIKGKAFSSPNILVGTHALIQDSVQLDTVGLVVIDEQHRFGVKQRSVLRNKGNAPHILTMTATPIPRTIALAFHGDLDMSVIDEMPTGRLPIKTWVVPPLKRKGAYEWIQKQVEAKIPHNQVFIVCPFIEPSESITSVKAATQEFETLKKEVFPTLSLGLLHGKMKSKEKDAILAKFKNHDHDILICTPVVEVGIDIPNATVMVIEAADRFGLAQLHQMRGRVGRSNMQSFCLLFSSNPDAMSRLKYLETITFGKELAEIDLKIRGAGKVFGTAQHGRDILKVASYEDNALVSQAQIEANTLVELDPTLKKWPLLKERLISSTISEIAPD